MINFTLRIDEETHKKIVEIAQKEERSINSQIIYILKKYIEEQNKKD